MATGEGLELADHVLAGAIAAAGWRLPARPVPLADSPKTSRKQ